jgi:deoxyribonuclease V
MNLRLEHEHPWNVPPAEAVEIQRRLAPLVVETPLANIETVAGIDVSVREDRVRAAVVVVELPDLAPVDSAVWEGPVAFPYLPGLLSFREAPAVLPALQKLASTPDLLMLDAQGLAHPRRFGLACHLGVLLDRPAIGVAKSRLVGTSDEPPQEKGAWTPLEHRGETIGAVLRTRERVHPVYVSVGHRATLADAVRVTMACVTRFKLPEPTRLAHRLSKTGRLD